MAKKRPTPEQIISKVRQAGGCPGRGKEHGRGAPGPSVQNEPGGWGSPERTKLQEEKWRPRGDSNTRPPV